MDFKREIEQSTVLNITNPYDIELPFSKVRKNNPNLSIFLKKFCFYRRNVTFFSYKRINSFGVV